MFEDALANAATKEAHREKYKKEAFERIKSDPMLKMGISTLGEAGKTEAFDLILAAAFEAGYETGFSTVVGELTESLFSKILKSSEAANSEKSASTDEDKGQPEEEKSAA